MKLVLPVPTCRHLIKAIEGEIECRQGLHVARCQTGDAYVDFFIKGDDASTESSLVEAMRSAIEEYVTRREEGLAREPGIPAPSRLYWRYAAPHIFLEHNYETQQFKFIRCRLVVTNKPEIYATVDDYVPTREAELEKEILHEGMRMQ